MDQKYKLLKTVQSLYEKGAVKLTASEQAIIEQETRDLLSASKTAAKAPEGFDNLLEQLKSIQNADEAFDAVLSFLKDKGDLESPMDDKGSMEGPEKKPEGPKPDMDKKPSMEKDIPKGPEKKPEGKGPEDKKDSDMGECPMKDKKVPGIGKGPVKDKDDLIARAKDLDKEAKESDEDLEALKEDDSDENTISAEALGVKSSIDTSRLKIKVTPERNVLVKYSGKPAFLHTVSDDIKKDDRKLVRLANKIMSWCTFEGLEVAAARCGSQIIGGVDEGIDLPFDADVSEATDPVTEGAENVMEEKEDSAPSEVTEKAEFDTQENHKNSAEKVAEGVDEDIDVTVKDSVDPTPSSVLDKAEDTAAESPDKPEGDTQTGAEVDFQTVEANMKKLYANRYSKEAQKQNRDFISKFLKCVKIASLRALKNHDDHYFKIAAYDVLTDEDVVAEVDEDSAVELAEMIASAGHEQFMNQLLKRTSELMKLSDEYLNDAEKDLEIQGTKPVELTEDSFVSPSGKSASVRKEAMNGNFSVVKAPASSRKNNKNNGGLRSVVGSTLMGQRAEKLSGLRRKQ